MLVRNDLGDVPRSIVLGEKTLWKVKQNYFWALFYNSLGIPLAALGRIRPEWAGLAMALSLISVVTNLLLLRRSARNLDCAVFSFALLLYYGHGGRIKPPGMRTFSVYVRVRAISLCCASTS